MGRRRRRVVRREARDVFWRIPSWSPLEVGMRDRGRVRVGSHVLEPGVSWVWFRIGRQRPECALVLRGCQRGEGLPARLVVLHGGGEVLVMGSEVVRVAVASGRGAPVPATAPAGDGMGAALRRAA